MREKKRQINPSPPTSPHSPDPLPGPPPPLRLVPSSSALLFLLLLLLLLLLYVLPLVPPPDPPEGGEVVVDDAAELHRGARLVVHLGRLRPVGVHEADARDCGGGVGWVFF